MYVLVALWKLLVYNTLYTNDWWHTVLIKVYHGTNLSSAFDIWLHGIDLNKSLPNLDFGKGFYVTDNKRKAIERALKKTNDYNRRYHCNEDPYLVEMYVDNNYFEEMHTRIFEPREKEWFDFVINNRMDLSYLSNYCITNHNKDNKYDIVFGEIADGKIADIVNSIKNSNLCIQDLDYSLLIPESGKFYGNQYSFHTQKSLSCIKDVSCDIIRQYRRKKVE